MLLAVDPQKDFINVEGIAIAPVLSFQSPGINSYALDAPKANRFAAYSDNSFSEQVFDVSMAEIETVVEPDGVADDIWWESVAFINSHRPSLPISSS